MRLDQFLVAKGHYETRARASDAIGRGVVLINGKAAKKSGQKIDNDAEITINDPASAYVSRAALKLKAGLEHFKFDANNKTALDIGSSTGGFTQVLLEHGAKHVIGIDVGTDQMHKTILSDNRVTQIDGLNARDLKASHLSGRNIEAVVSDVSFISLKLAQPPALMLAEPRAFAILLVKPQFEAGREAIGKGGLLKDPTTGPVIAEDLLKWLDSQPGWSATEFIASPIAGGDGNQEYLIGGVKT